MFLHTDKDYNGFVSFNELKDLDEEVGMPEDETQSEAFANFLIRLGDHDNDHQLNSEGVQFFFLT